MFLIKSNNFNFTILNALEFLKNQNKFDKSMIFFWFLGPVIFLIERSPSDFWLSVISVLFLFRSIYLNDWKWFKIRWFQFSFIFWLVSLVSAFLSIMPIFSSIEGFLWLRFPLFAIATQYWLGKNRDIRAFMMIVIIFCMLVMSLILFLEAYLEPKERLTWPYGDLIPGSYLAKFCLPACCVLAVVMFKDFSKRSFLSSIIYITALIASILTGERTNLILKTCATVISVFFSKFNLKIIFSWITILILILFSMYAYNPKIYKGRYSPTYFISHIPIINFETSYWGTWRSGIQQGLENPILGVGPSGTRHTCGYLKENNFLPGKNYCGNHPHNMHIQVFAETGIMGYIFFLLMLISILYTCYTARKINKYCIMAATAFISPLAFFFPLQETGSFFGQWNNLFIWFSIGISLAQSNKT